MSSIISKK
jgi:hypothetical protein